MRAEPAVGTEFFRSEACGHKIDQTQDYAGIILYLTTSMRRKLFCGGMHLAL
jgi:hypothetical protein